MVKHKAKRGTQTLPEEKVDGDRSVQISQNLCFLISNTSANKSACLVCCSQLIHYNDLCRTGDAQGEGGRSVKIKKWRRRVAALGQQVYFIPRVSVSDLILIIIVLMGNMVQGRRGCLQPGSSGPT